MTVPDHNTGSPQPLACKLDVLAIGELLIDLAPAGRNEVGYPMFSALPGGAPANFLAACSARGLRPGFVGAVGNDDFGSLLLNTLNKKGIDTSQVQICPDAFTTMAFVTLDESGDRSFSFARKPGADEFFRMDDAVEDQLDKARVLHFGTFIMSNEQCAEQMKKAVLYARQSGRWVSFDPNYRALVWKDPEAAREAVRWGLAHCDSVKIGLDELVFAWPELEKRSDLSRYEESDGLPPDEAIEAALRLLFKYGSCSLAFVTLGAGGSIVARRRQTDQGPELVEWVSVPGFVREDTVDTTGAGDIFGGTALSEFLLMAEPGESLRQVADRATKEELWKIGVVANAIASLSTTRFGGISSVPSRTEADALISSLGLMDVRAQLRSMSL